MDNILFYNGFRFSTYIYRNEHTTDNSCGTQTHFIGRLLSGSAALITEDGDHLELFAGDIFYIPQGLRYHSYWYPSSDGDVTLESYGFTYFPCKTGRRYLMQKLSVPAEAIEFLNKLSENKTVCCSSIGLLYAFLGNAFPYMSADDTCEQRRLFSKAKLYISKNPCFKGSELAKHCGMSESSLYAFFKSYASTTPIELKNRIQTEKAINLLCSTDLSVEEIGNRVGFVSVAYFRKMIKSATGKTPTQIRKQHSKKYNI